MRLRRVLAALAIATAGAGAVAPPATALDESTVRARLARDVRLAGPFAGAYVRELDTGHALLARQEDAARPPASVQKLYTTSTALMRFGAGETLRTQVLGAGTLDPRGVWRGDLYLRGGGDPTLTRAQLTTLADALVHQLGVVRIAGSVLGDESLFDSRRGATRTGFAFDRDVGGVLSALAVSRGFARDASPATEAARRLARALRASGVRVSGRSATGVAPAGAPELVALASPPMRDLARLVNVPSDNFAAEMLLKALGARFGAGGTTRAGSAVVREQLASFGIHPRVVDGSGLSRANRTTPRQVVRLLERMHGQLVGPAFEASLAVAGRSGTLRRRLRGTPAQDRCRGKTGTLRAVSTLAGICYTTGGRVIGFAMMMSGPRIDRARRLQDRMTAAIAAYGG